MGTSGALARDYRPEIEALRIRVGGDTLAASYSPSGDTAIVAVHGAEAGTRDDPLYRHLHELLPPVGIGVVTFDRRGEGESTGRSTRGRFDLQAQDVLSVLEAADARRVGLWGISQGGWVGPLAAAESEKVAFLVVVASAGVTPAEQMMYAVERQLRLAGYADEVVAHALELRRRFDEWVHGVASEPEERLAADLAAGAEQEWWPSVWLRPTLPDEEDRRLWIEEMDFEPRPVFARTRVPTLAFYGEADSWIPVAASVAAWRAARGNDVDIVVIPEAGHDLTLPDGSLSPEYQRTLVNWVADQRVR